MNMSHRYQLCSYVKDSFLLVRWCCSRTCTSTNGSSPSAATCPSSADPSTRPFSSSDSGEFLPVECLALRTYRSRKKWLAILGRAKEKCQRLLVKHEICQTQECLHIVRRLLWKQTRTHSIRNNNPMFVQQPLTLFFCTSQYIFKKDPGRAKLISQGTAGRNFTKPSTCHFSASVHTHVTVTLNTWHINVVISFYMRSRKAWGITGWTAYGACPPIVR